MNESPGYNRYCFKTRGALTAIRGISEGTGTAIFNRMKRERSALGDCGEDLLTVRAWRSLASTARCCLRQHQPQTGASTTQGSHKVASCGKDLESVRCIAGSLFFCKRRILSSPTSPAARRRSARYCAFAVRICPGALDQAKKTVGTIWAYPPTHGRGSLLAFQIAGPNKNGRRETCLRSA